MLVLVTICQGGVFSIVKYFKMKMLKGTPCTHIPKYVAQH